MRVHLGFQNHMGSETDDITMILTEIKTTQKKEKKKKIDIKTTYLQEGIEAHIF